jgi:hypothetical protein
MSAPLHAEFELPDLRFVAVESLVPHERHDEQRAMPLVERMKAAGVLKNPPVVAPLDAAASRFVVLDGANRTIAARVAGLPHLLVQVVDYASPELGLSTWNHALVDVDPEWFRIGLESVAGLRIGPETAMHARAMLARREAIAIADFGGETLALCGDGDLHARNVVLNGIVDLYRGVRRFHRVTGETLAAAKARFPGASVLVVFPHFEKAEIVELATSGARVPAGITRHLIPWRALRLNVPLETLADASRTCEQKTAWLAGWVAERVVRRNVRFYEESTVVFDE